MKVLITGSHFTPAQAVMEELKKDDSLEIVYVGRKTAQEGDKTPSVESQLLPNLGIRFIPLTTGRIQRTFTRYTIPSIVKIPWGILQALYINIKEKPDVILSFGGYIAVPVCFSGWLLNIPIIIHEQTLVSGLANSTTSLFASKIAISFNETHLFGKKAILTGNPIRGELLNKNKDISSDLKIVLSEAKKNNLPVLLITSGNQGSHIINKSVEDILPNLLNFSCVIHQTGDSKFHDFERLENLRQTLKFPKRYQVRKWIEGKDFGALLKMVNLTIARGGINTLVELAYFGVPTLVIPIPYLYKNEQMVNARYFEKLKLARILLQSELSGTRLLSEIKKIMPELKQWREAAKNAKGVVIIDAAKRLALETLILALE